MGFKRSSSACRQIEAKLRAGMARTGIAGARPKQIIARSPSFALYGFPESHAASFALLAYASAYLKAHHPGGVLRGAAQQPADGVLSPGDARARTRSGAASGVIPIDVHVSDWHCTVEADEAVRLGLRYVKGLREAAGKRIEEERRRRPSSRRTIWSAHARLRRDELTQLARVGALASLEPERRAALWEAERAVRPRGVLYDALPDRPEAPRFR